jgi:hypothetical protein
MKKKVWVNLYVGDPADDADGKTLNDSKIGVGLNTYTSEEEASADGLRSHRYLRTVGVWIYEKS